MGLLQRAYSNKFPLENSKNQEDKGFPSFKKKILIDEFLTKVNQINQGFEYSKNLFEELSSILNFQKGALLILESDIHTFIPISFKNLDLTTSRHLRIPEKTLSNQFQNYNEILNISDKKIKIFKQFFSIREFSALDSIIIIPFYNIGILSALLLVIDPSTDIINIAGELSLRSEKFISKLIKSRRPFSNSFKSSIKKEIPQPQLVLQEYIDNNSIEGISFLIIKLNFLELENTLIKLLPNTDSYEINNNIIISITQLISPSGKLLKIDANNYLLFYKIKTGKTSGIILHQINLAISTFFNLSEPLPKIVAEIKTIPDKLCDTAKNILEDIL